MTKLIVAFRSFAEAPERSTAAAKHPWIPECWNGTDEAYRHIQEHRKGTVRFMSCWRTNMLVTMKVHRLARFKHVLRGGVDKSLARPNSQCRRTESMVSLERGVCSCSELVVFSCCRGWKEACQATHAISTTQRRELWSSFFFPSRQGAEGSGFFVALRVLWLIVYVSFWVLFG